MAEGDIYSPGGGVYDPSGSVDADEERRRRREAGLDPVTGEPPPDNTVTGQAGDPAYDANPRDYMINRDREQWRNRLRGVAQPLNFANWEQAADEELEGAIRQISYAQNAGQNPDVFLSAAEERLRQRGAPMSGGETNTPGGGSGGGGNGGGPDASMTQILLPPKPTSGTTSTGQPMQVDSAIGDLFRYMQQRDQQQQTERASMRQMLMEQLGQASRPVDVNDPTLRRIIDPQRLELQRSAERQRSQMAARLASDNLLDSGTFDTAVSGIEQQRGEAAAGVTGRVLSGELQSRRDQLTRLMTLAMQSGDAESARTIQAQLGLIDSQIGREQGLNQLGYNYTALESQLAQAMLPYQYADVTELLSRS